MASSGQEISTAHFRSKRIFPTSQPHVIAVNITMFTTPPTQLNSVKRHTDKAHDRTQLTNRVMSQSAKQQKTARGEIFRPKNIEHNHKKPNDTHTILRAPPPNPKGLVKTQNS